MSKNNNPIPDLLFHTAKGFYDIGFNCAYNINLGKDNNITRFQRIAPAAVNYSFALELFIKDYY